MGRTIIVSTIRYALGFSGQEKNFHKAFQEYLSNKLVNPGTTRPAFWISVSGTSPLGLNQLFECVFAPYIAELLITQDLAVDEGQALTIREHSKLYGDLIINANTEDGLLDNVIQSTIHTNLEASPLNCCDLILIVISYDVHLGDRSLEYNFSSGFYQTQATPIAKASSSSMFCKRKCEGR